jgi:acetyl esterase/lipase
MLLVLLRAATMSAATDAFIPSGPVIPIWPGVAPGSEGKTAPERWIEGGTPDAFHRVTNIHQPSLTIYLPEKEKSTGTAFIIAPGGGHRYLVVDLEGEFVAKKLNEMGVAAFVLRSRLAHADGSTYRVEIESLADMQQAIRVVRGRAAEWNVNPSRVGVMGFSAGGHLAALAENEFDASTRPDFAVLGYPGFGHARVQIVKDAPPTFLLLMTMILSPPAPVNIISRCEKPKFPLSSTSSAAAGTALAPPAATRRISINSASLSGPICSRSG